MGATSGTGTAYPSGEPEFTPVFSWVRIVRSLVFCVMFYPFVLFSFCHCVICPSIYIITPLVSSNSSYKKKYQYQLNEQLPQIIEQ